MALTFFEIVHLQEQAPKKQNRILNLLVGLLALMKNNLVRGTSPIQENIEILETLAIKGFELRDNQKSSGIPRTFLIGQEHCSKKLW